MLWCPSCMTAWDVHNTLLNLYLTESESGAMALSCKAPDGGGGGSGDQNCSGRAQGSVRHRS